MTKDTRKRSPSQIARHRRKIGELYLKGRHQEEIAQELGIAQSTVSRDLKYLLNDWEQEARQSVEQRKAEIEQKYLFVWREAIDAWDNSKQDATTTIQEMIEAGDSSNGSGRLKASTKTEGQSGNPALLAQAQAALKALREILGVDAAAKVEHSGPGGGPIPIKEIVVNREPVDDSE